MDKSRTTGAEGGKDVILDDVDNLVIDIIGEYFVYQSTTYVKTIHSEHTIFITIVDGMNEHKREITGSKTKSIQ